MELPLWLPDKVSAMNKIDAGKAMLSGLTHMPLAEIIQSTLDWYKDEPERDWPAGMSERKERQLLEAWRAGS